MIEKIGFYAPIISPLLIALAAGLGLPESHGLSVIGRAFVVIGSLCFAVAAFRRLHNKPEQTADR